jgi:hypothetical protein
MPIQDFVAVSVDMPDPYKVVSLTAFPPALAALASVVSDSGTTTTPVTYTAALT